MSTAFRRTVPHARVRRGFKPDPELPASLFEAEPVPDVDFNMFDFSKLKGDVCLVVNVASSDDFTEPMYKMMANLLEKYHDSGFHVLAFPCNWFGQKEAGSYEDIKKYVHDTYSDKLTLFTKIDLDWNPIFAMGLKHYPGEIIWNFHGQFLFNRDGIPVDRFDLLTPADYVEERVRKQVLGADAVVDEPDVPEPAADEVEAEVA